MDLVSLLYFLGSDATSTTVVSGPVTVPMWGTIRSSSVGTRVIIFGFFGGASWSVLPFSDLGKGFRNL